MSWIQLKRSPRLRNGEFKEYLSKQSQPMFEGSDEISDEMQHQIESHLVSAYDNAINSPLHTSKNSLSNFDHPSYRNYEKRTNKREFPYFFDYNRDSSKLHLLQRSPIEKHQDIRSQESQINIESQSQNIHINDNAAFDTQSHRHNQNKEHLSESSSISIVSKNKKLSREEIIQKAQEENFSSQFSSPKSRIDEYFSPQQSNINASTQLSLSNEKPRSKKMSLNKSSSKVDDICSRINKRQKAYSKNNSNPSLEQTSNSAAPKPRTKKKIFQKASNNEPNPTFIMTEETFLGIERCEILNSGASDEALDVFFQKAIKGEHDYICWTLLFYDYSLSTPFLPCTKKYCTEKGPQCVHWNCTCDDQIRAMQAKAPIFGVMFVFASENPSFEGETDCFILPLGPSTSTVSNDDTLTFDRMRNWPRIPFNCNSNMKRRWNIFRQILLQKQVRCVTFNPAVALMVLHYHNLNDLDIPMDLIFTSIWDLKLAVWMLRPHASEKELEFESIIRGFPHLKTKNEKIQVPQNSSSQLCSLVEVKHNLEFLHSLHPIISQTLRRKNLEESFCHIESPLQTILAAMECHGVGFLPNRLKKRQEKLDRRIDKLIRKARNIANDDELLLSSPQQISKFIFDIMKIPFPRKIESKGKSHNSTSNEVLEAIQSESEQPNKFVNIILEFRNLNKLLTSFIIPLPILAQANDKDSSYRIHPMWCQTVVRTGRLSCRKPNMQQIPNEGALGISPRDSFCASSSNKCLFACDYCQNEIRILAHMSNDPQLIALFNDPDEKDIYKQMSSAVTGKKLEEVTDKERSKAKQVTLAILYGMGIQQVSKKLNISTSEAKNLFHSFFRRFTGVRKWIDQTKEFVKEHAHVTTITGRRRYLDDINSNDKGKRAQAERQAVNSIIQGSAADLMKLAMLKMCSRLMDWKKEICSFSKSSLVTGVLPILILQIHDELLFEVASNEADVELLKEITLRCCTEECERDLRLKVPLKLKFQVGLSWGESMKKL